MHALWIMEMFMCPPPQQTLGRPPRCQAMAFLGNSRVMNPPEDTKNILLTGIYRFGTRFWEQKPGFESWCP